MPTLVVGMIEVPTLHQFKQKRYRQTVLFQSDKVVSYDIGFLPKVVAEAVLFQTEHKAFLVFNATKEMPDGTFGAEGTGLIEILGCHITKFGYPNDEALGGHPLALRGLTFYGVFEVLDSSWIKDLTKQNRACFPKTRESDQKHFIFTFQDSTFECIADNLIASLNTEPCDKICRQIVERILGNETAG